MPTKITTKRYRCRRCGHETTQQTGHFGSTWSYDRLNCCPKCPPYAKYPEFGGQTIWDCAEEGADPPLSDDDVKTQSRSIADAIEPYIDD